MPLLFALQLPALSSKHLGLGFLKMALEFLSVDKCLYCQYN